MQHDHGSQGGCGCHGDAKDAKKECCGGHSAGADKKGGCGCDHGEVNKDQQRECGCGHKH